MAAAGRALDSVPYPRFKGTAEGVTRQHEHMVQRDGAALITEYLRTNALPAYAGARLAHRGAQGFTEHSYLADHGLGRGRASDESSSMCGIWRAEGETDGSAGGLGVMKTRAARLGTHGCAHASGRLPRRQFTLASGTHWGSSDSVLGTIRSQGPSDAVQTCCAVVVHNTYGAQLCGDAVLQDGIYEEGAKLSTRQPAHKEDPMQATHLGASGAAACSAVGAEIAAAANGAPFGLRGRGAGDRGRATRGGSSARHWTEEQRLGEASNPGPPVVHAIARRVPATEAGGSVQYPAPGRGSLADVMAPGHRQGPRQALGDFRLVLETVNATGWTALKQRLLDTEAHALLAQETWVDQSAMAGAAAWARRHGWRSVWAPAVTTAKGGTAAGVAIFVRDCFGLHLPADGSHILSPARAVMAIMETPGARPIRLISCYLRHGRKACEINDITLGAVGQAVDDCGDEEACVVGGDFNREPADFLEAGFDRRIAATLFHPPTERGTYRTARGRSLIDFFFVADRLAAAVDDVRTVEATGVRGHVPVQLAFKPRLAAVRALHIRQPPRIPTERVFGPLPPPGEWTHRAAVAAAALAAARAGAPETERLLEAAYAQWAEGAEEELEAFAGTTISKKGERGKRPKLVWRSVLPERKLAPRYPALAVATWLKGISAELQRIVALAAAAGGGTEGAGGDCDEDCPSDDDGYISAETDAVQDDARDRQLAADADPSRAERRGRRPPTSWRHCSAVLDDIFSSLDRDAPGGDEPADIAMIRGDIMKLVNDVRTSAVEDGSEASGAAPAAADGAPATGPAPWPQRAAIAVASWAPRVDEVRERLEAMVAALTSSDRAEASRAWREWLHDGIDAGARRAHMASRLPLEVAPTSVETVGGAMSAAPEELLDAQRRKLRGLWKPAAGAFHYLWPDRSELPRLDARGLRDAATSFQWRTTQTYDGFHPRQLGNLPDAALETLADILQAVEVSGIWPPQVAMVITALLPKPKGGLRPIGILPGVYRLWAKARRVLADEWEAAHQRPFFSSAKGNGPLDTLWRMSARHEAGIADDQQAGIVADDLAAFFETVDRDTLMREAQALNYPVPVLRAALAAYAAPRMLTLQGRVARELHPTVGVIAGCSLAMSLVKLFYLRAFDDLAARLPPAVTLDVHVDDVTLAAIGPPPQVAADLAAARHSLAHTMERLGCTFAHDKTAVTATTRQLAGAITRRLGLEEGVVGTPCLLGVDSTAGNRRARLGRTSRRAGRLRAALARRVRLQRLRRDVGRRATRVFRSGVLPAAAYDSPVWGLSDAECLRLRRLAAATMTPRAKGRSLTMVHLWHDMPTADAENAPVVHYGKMIWRAVTRREDAMARGSSLADLRRLWESASTAFAPLAQKMLDARGPDGAVPHRVARAVWAEVRGPLSAAAVTLARNGCVFQSPFSFVDALGVEHCLTTMSPRLLRDIMRDMTRLTMEKKVGSAIAERHAAFDGRRACLDLAIAAARVSKRVTPHQSGAFRAVACDAVWTAVKARERGYLTSGDCPLCGEAPDTIGHRTYGCAKTEDAVREAVPAWFWREATCAHRSSPFWTTAIIPHPADVAPPPRDDFTCHVEHHTPEGREAANDENRQHLKGSLYVDGSCFPSPIRGLARAAMAIRMVSPLGDPIKTLQMAVPRHLPQTAQVAENLSTAVAYQSIRGAADIAGDCLNVVKAFAAPIARALRPSNKYAGLVMSAYADIGRWRTTGIRWIRAHRKATGEEDRQEAIDIAANAAVDLAAKEAVAMHPPLGTDITAGVEYHAKRAPHVVAAVTAAMRLFPPAPKGLPRAPRPSTIEEARREKKHLWQHVAGAWRCTACGDYVTAPTVPRYRQHQACTGKNISDSAPLFTDMGHSLIRVEADLPFVICSRCGSWGNRRTRGLGRRCAAPTAAGKQAIARVFNGWHPLLQKGRDGTDLPRQRVTAAAAYDPIGQEWRPIGSTARAAAPTPAADAGASCHHHHHHHGDGDLRGRDMTDLDGHSSPHGPMDCQEEQPPSVADDADFSEPDVFGHGGSMDDDHAAPQPCPAPSEEGGATRARPAVEWPAAQPATRRRQRPISAGDSRGRDFVKEAVDRVGSTLRRNDTDPRGRMDRLRQRVANKAAAVGEQQPAPSPSPRMEQPGGCSSRGPPVEYQDAQLDRPAERPAKRRDRSPMARSDDEEHRQTQCARDLRGHRDVRACLGNELRREDDERRVRQSSGPAGLAPAHRRGKRSAEDASISPPPTSHARPYGGVEDYARGSREEASGTQEEPHGDVLLRADQGRQHPRGLKRHLAGASSSPDPCARRPPRRRGAGAMDTPKGDRLVDGRLHDINGPYSASVRLSSFVNDQDVGPTGNGGARAPAADRAAGGGASSASLCSDPGRQRPAMPGACADASAEQGHDSARARTSGQADEGPAPLPPLADVLTRDQLLARLRQHVGQSRYAAAASWRRDGRGHADGDLPSGSSNRDFRADQLACERGGQCPAEPMHAARGGEPRAAGEAADGGCAAVTCRAADATMRGVVADAEGNRLVGSANGTSACGATEAEATCTLADPSSVAAAGPSHHFELLGVTSASVPARRRLVGKQRPGVAGSTAPSGFATGSTRTTPSPARTSHGPPGRPPDTPA